MMEEYEQYMNTNLVSCKEKYDEKTVVLFDKYLHLTFDEYNKVKTFCYENGFTFNKKRLNFDIKLKKSDESLYRKIQELEKSIPNLSTVTSNVYSTESHTIYLKRYAWCRVHENILLLEKWYKSKGETI